MNSLPNFEILIPCRNGISLFCDLSQWAAVMHLHLLSKLLPDMTRVHRLVPKRAIGLFLSGPWYSLGDCKHFASAFSKSWGQVSRLRSEWLLDGSLVVYRATVPSGFMNGEGCFCLRHAGPCIILILCRMPWRSYALAAAAPQTSHSEAHGTVSVRNIAPFFPFLSSSLISVEISKTIYVLLSVHIDFKFWWIYFILSLINLKLWWIYFIFENSDESLSSLVWLIENCDVSFHS